MARSATRPDSSIRPVPYTTSSRTAGTSGATATGRRRAVPGLLSTRPPGRARGGMRGAMSGAFTAASLQEAAGAARRSAGLRVQAMSGLGEISPVWVSEGGLDPRSWWYIPKRGIHHQPKLTRQGPSGRHSAGEQQRSRRRHNLYGFLACGNYESGQPRWSAGQDRTTASVPRRPFGGHAW